ncbi:winged helix-turn-helix domain-containing protein [Mycobacterium simulans]|uniref:winged helix-turn-helix domain-containing protein n=1 Tax=Mycobacterium simulans TaxID=627089 RepID=UPI0036F31784
MDRSILAVISENSDLTNKALAHRLGLAESTCAYMVRLGSHSRQAVNRLYDELIWGTWCTAGVPCRR